MFHPRLKRRGFHTEYLVKYIRTVESSLGYGVKRVYPGEKSAMERLRRRDTLTS